MWVFSIWLYLLFMSWMSGNELAGQGYRGLIENGATCYVWIADDGERPTSAPPPCWYLGEK